MKKYSIELHYCADVLQIFEYETLEDEENILERIEDGEFEILEDECYNTSIDEIHVNGEKVTGWTAKDDENIPLPEEGLYAKGGTCSGWSTLTLELPDNEKFDARKLLVGGFTDVTYRMDDKQVISAEWEDDNEEEIENGNEFYYNGNLLQ